MSRFMHAFHALYERRIRGVRLVDLGGAGLALILIFGIGLSKVREDSDVKRLKQLDRDIAEAQGAISQLKLNVSSLEEPRRLEMLAAQVLDMHAVRPDHEADLDSLAEISHTSGHIVPTQSTLTPTIMAVVHNVDLTGPEISTQPHSDDLITTHASEPSPVKPIIQTKRATQTPDRSAESEQAGSQPNRMKIDVIDPGRISANTRGGR